MAPSRIRRLFVAGKIRPRQQALTQQEVPAVHRADEVAAGHDAPVADHDRQVHHGLYGVAQPVQHRIVWRAESDRDAEWIDGVGWISHLRLVVEEV